MKNSTVSSWKLAHLGEIARVIPGFAFKSQDWQEYGIPVIKIKNITNDNRVDVSDVDHVPEYFLTSRLQKFVLSDGDVLVAMTGATAGKVGRLRTRQPMLLNQRVAKIEPVNVEPEFLWEVLSSKEYQSRFYHLADGAAQPNMSGSQIEQVEIHLPPLPTQRKIAAVLSAYDDLIENNTRRIQILEEMAQALYREWFVHFRFPGHEQSKMVESVLGPIPEGWEFRRLGDFAQETRRSVDINKVAPETPYVGLEHIPRKSIALHEWGRADEVHSTKLKFDEGDILFGKIRPYFHKVSIAPIAGICSSDIIVVKAKRPEYFAMALCCISSDDFISEATQTSQGTKMPRANWEVLTKFPVAMPPEHLLTKFNDFALNSLNLIKNLATKNKKLRQTRDLLLPKLISGEVEVSDLSIG